ncbi:MAG TPA: hypothetical protein VGE30_02650 [Candidatus Saccharimonadales bacterium]
MATQKAKPKKVTKAQKAAALQKALKREAPEPPVVYARIPNVFILTKQAAVLSWRNKKLLGGITLTYLILSLLFVRGLGAGPNFTELREQLGTASAYGQFLSNPSGAETPAAGTYQLILFILVSLATIWALRRTVAGDTVTTKDAFYRGMHPFVPFVLVLMVIGLQLIPALVGVSAYQLAVLSGIAASTVETIVWAVGAFALSLVSLYFVAASVLALYIVTLPEMTPLLALRMGRRLVRGRRWTVLRKLLFLPLVLILTVALIMAPFIFLVPIVASWVLFILGAIALVVAHVYLYNLYQGLLREQQTDE